MTNEHMQIVEVNGIKLEIDTRTAKVVSNFKIGDNVKVLIKEYSSYKSCFGVIVGFDQFAALPTIVVGYLDNNYASGEIKFCYINNQSEGIELCHVHTHEMIIDKNMVLKKLDNAIEYAEKQLIDLKYKREYFLSNFNAYFEKDIPKI